jgi:hypothetical protein
MRLPCDLRRGHLRRVQVGARCRPAFGWVGLSNSARGILADRDHRLSVRRSTCVGGDQTTNQSLEQITDWLTKIIIGATLVQLGAIGSFIADVGDSIGEASKLAAGPQLYTALIVATAACGFIFFYFWTRMCWETMRRREQLGHAK